MFGYVWRERIRIGQTRRTKQATAKNRDCSENVAHSGAYARIFRTEGVPYFPEVHFIPLAFNEGKANSP